MLKSLVVVMFISVFALSSCSTKTPKEFFAEFEVKDNTAEINACRAWKKEKEFEERKQYDKLQSHDMSYALMHRETMSMVKEVFGKGDNECKPGTNEWDAYIAYVKEKGQTDRVIAQEVGSGVKTLAIVGGASYVGGKLVDEVGDKVQGDQIVTGRDNAKTGKGDVGLAGTNTQTSSVTSEQTSQVSTASSESPISTTKTTPPAVTNNLTTPVE